MSVPFVQATPIINFVDVLQNDSGPFQFSLLHEANRNSTQSGQHLANLELDILGMNRWDLVPGQLDLSLLIYEQSSSAQIGRAHLTSHNFDAINFGTLNWKIQVQTGNLLETYLSANFPLTGSYYELEILHERKTFATSSEGYTANSFRNDRLVLWGASNRFNSIDNQHRVGVDLVLVTQAVPEPSTYLLLFALAVIFCLKINRPLMML